MASRSSYNKSKRRSRGEDVELVPVRSNIFYGIKTKIFDEQKTNTERKIVVVPNITYYNNYTKAFIDFSDYLNNPKTSDVKSFFALLINGLNFTISNALWTNPLIDKASYVLNGTYKFTKIVDNIVFVDVVSIESYSTKITRYDKEFFEQLPTIQFSTTITPDKKETKSYIFNYLGKNSKNSFAYLGLQVGDYIQLQNKDIKYKIETYEIDAEGKETLVVYGQLTDEDNVGNPFLLTLNQLNKNKIQLNYNNEILGKCEIVVSSSIVNCVDNHTELQSKLREDTFTGITTRFVAGEFCVVLATEFDSNKDKNLISTLVEENFNLKNQNIKNRTINTQDTNLLSRTNLISTLFSN